MKEMQIQLLNNIESLNIIDFKQILQKISCNMLFGMREETFM